MESETGLTDILPRMPFHLCDLQRGNENFKDIKQYLTKDIKFIDVKQSKHFDYLQKHWTMQEFNKRVA